MKTEQIDKLYKECPNAMEMVEDYLHKHMNATPEGLKEAEALKAQFGDNKKVAARLFLAMGERFLYEFFDEKELIVEITSLVPDPKQNKVQIRSAIFRTELAKGWEWEGSSLIVGFFDSRQEAERSAFEKGFEILESKLG